MRGSVEIGREELLCLDDIATVINLTQITEYLYKSRCCTS